MLQIVVWTNLIAAIVIVALRLLILLHSKVSACCLHYLLIISSKHCHNDSAIGEHSILTILEIV